MTLRRTLLALALCALVAPFAAFAAENDPVITVPADMTVEAQNFSGATVTYTASAVDYRGRPITVTCVPASGTIFGFGPTTVRCTARDSEGHTASKQFRVTVVDRTPPAISVPPNKQVATKSRAGAAVGYTVSATDIVDGPVTATCAPSSGASFVVGTTKVTCTASDRRNNASSASFDVTVVLVQARKAQSTTMLAPKAGARITRPPLLRWRAARAARFYNLQIYRHGRKVLSVWPSRSRFRLRARWTFNGRSFRLRPGRYTWLVWPAYGPTSRPRFGRLLGISSFVVVKKATSR